MDINCADRQNLGFWIAGMRILLPGLYIPSGVLCIFPLLFLSVRFLTGSLTCLEGPSLWNVAGFLVSNEHCCVFSHYFYASVIVDYHRVLCSTLSKVDITSLGMIMLFLMRHVAVGFFFCIPYIFGRFLKTILGLGIHMLSKKALQSLVCKLIDIEVMK